MWRLSLLALFATTAGQIPTLGWCPTYQFLANFDMARFLGTWYEAERYFTVREMASRCVGTKYMSTPEGRITVANEFTNSVTGAKRVLEGHLQTIGREGEGRFIVRYSALPIPIETEYSILDTDYDNWAVMWSCSGIGPVHTQNAWILTRKRLAPISEMQAAYGILDKFKIYRTFFVKTPQEGCNILPIPTGDADSKSAVEVVASEKEAVVSDIVDKVVELVEKPVDPEVPAVKSASPAESKRVQVPELRVVKSDSKKEKPVDDLQKYNKKS